jgi:hypothetical protein
LAVAYVVSNDGTLTNFNWDSTSNWTSGYNGTGTGLKFDGVDDYILSKHNTTVNDRLTVSAWVYAKYASLGYDIVNRNCWDDYTNNWRLRWSWGALEFSYGNSTTYITTVTQVGTMAAKMAIRDVARVQKLPLPEADKLAKLVPEKTRSFT